MKKNNGMVSSDFTSKIIKEYVFKSSTEAKNFDKLITSNDYLMDFIDKHTDEIFSDENISISDPIIDDDELPEYKNGHLNITIFLKDLLETFFGNFDWEKELSNIGNLIGNQDNLLDYDYYPLQKFMIKNILKYFNKLITIKIK